MLYISTQQHAHVVIVNVGADQPKRYSDVDVSPDFKAGVYELLRDKGGKLEVVATVPVAASVVEWIPPEAAVSTVPIKW